jgi:hypothetical protein
LSREDYHSVLDVWQPVPPVIAVRREALCLPSGIHGGDPQERNVTPVDLVQLGVLGWLSLAGMTVSSSWVNVDRSAFLCR